MEDLCFGDGIKNSIISTKFVMNMVILRVPEAILVKKEKADQSR